MGNGYHYDAVERDRLMAQADLFGGADLRRLQAALGVPATALEVGCGPGGFAARVRHTWGVPRVEGLEAHAATADRAAPLIDAVHRRDALDDDPLPGAALMYARLVARHVPDVTRLVARMVDACAPDGHVLLIDADDATLLLHPAAEAFERARRATHARARAGGADPFVGRRLPALLRAAGLVDVDGFALTLTSFERPRAAFAAMLRPYTLTENNGLPADACAAAQAALETDVRDFSWTMFHVWGRKPAAAASR
ncbi:MAG: methyltransferase domain-containing protein [Myxococcales bacterium]|nr:methyltransferase domain-containing protein [Myxococcales bacterium]